MTRDWIGFMFLLPVIFAVSLVCAVWAVVSWAWDRRLTRLALIPTVFALGCGGSAIENHLGAARIAHVAIEATAGGIEAACDRPTVEAADDPPARARGCLRAKEVHDALRAAWSAWVSALAVSEDEADWLELALDLATLYQQTAGALQEWGVAAPSLPAFFGGD